MRRTSTRRRSSSILQMRRKGPTRYRQNSPRREPRRGLPILRGSSSSARRSRRNFRIRPACWRSSLRRSRSASTENSIFQGMTFQDVFERNGGGLTAANAVEGTLGEIQVFQFVEMLKDGFAHVKGLGAPSALGELFQALFNGFGQADGQHRTSLYKYSMSVMHEARENRLLAPTLRRGARTSFRGFPLPCAKTGGRRRRRRRGGRS